MTQLTKLPTLQDLLVENEDSLKQNALTVLLNQDPPAKWLVQHPMIRDYRYIPIEKIEYLNVLKFLEKDNLLDPSKPVGLLREITEHISIRSGKFGDYIFYKKPRMKKPEFLKLNGFNSDYKKCEKDLLINWIKQTYNKE